MGTHPIFESDFDCLTEDQMGLFGNKSFNKKKTGVRKSVSLNNLTTDPTMRKRDLHPDPDDTQFQVGGTTLLIKDGQVMATGGGGVQDVNMKQENQQLKEIVNKLRLEKEILLDMLAEVTAEMKLSS